MMDGCAAVLNGTRGKTSSMYGALLLHMTLATPMKWRVSIGNMNKHAHKNALLLEI